MMKKLIESLVERRSYVDFVKVKGIFFTLFTQMPKVH